MGEFETKIGRIRRYCAGAGYDGMFLSRRANFSWLSCGGNSTVERCTDFGVADLLVLADRQYVLASEIERYKIMDEVLKPEMGFELEAFPWGGTARAEAVSRLTRGKRIVSDAAFPGMDERAGEIAELRYALTAEEEARYRELALESAIDLENLCRSIEPGMTEYEVASKLMAGSVRAGGDAPVALVAFDDRIQLYRHPAPTGKKLIRRALLARCSQRGGLIVSLSRLVCFGKLEDEIMDRHRACAQVNAAFIAATTKGARGIDIFAKGIAAYAESGFPGEWQKHHQGGALGYACRDYVIDSSYDATVLDNQAFSWNPSIAGSKIEETIIVKGDRQELLTATREWPRFDVTAGATTVSCPDILIR
jgi:Xaa-Pro dipeptidase